MDPVVSFVVRVRNEEATLADSLTSLFALQFPVQVVVVLQLCVDDSEAIVERVRQMSPAHVTWLISKFDLPCSRAGLETWITPAEHPQSFVRFSNFCFGLATARWKFKWDADFVATPAFLDFMNSRRFDVDGPTVWSLHYKNPDDSVGCEPYLSNCLTQYRKYNFWEVPQWVSGAKQIKNDKHEAWEHRSPLVNIKPYWMDEPWFFGNDNALTAAYKAAVEQVGPEPIGAARANNPACDVFYFKCLQLLPQVA